MIWRDKGSSGAGLQDEHSLLGALGALFSPALFNKCQNYLFTCNSPQKPWEQTVSYSHPNSNIYYNSWHILIAKQRYDKKKKHLEKQITIVSDQSSSHKMSTHHFGYYRPSLHPWCGLWSHVTNKRITDDRRNRPLLKGERQEKTHVLLYLLKLCPGLSWGSKSHMSNLLL